MSAASSYGYQLPTIRPLALGPMQFRYERIKRELGLEDEFDRQLGFKARAVEERPPVVMNQYLVAVTRRPEISDYSMQPHLREPIMNRLPIVGRNFQDYTVAGATPPRPITTQYFNAEFNEQQHARARIVM